MKIAVFGDSFAADRSTFNRSTESGWAEHLRSFGYVIDNYATSGSSLYHAWKKFNKLNYDHYDAIVFIITGFGRFEINVGEQEFKITSVGQLEVILKNKDCQLTKYQRSALEAYKNYLLMCYDVDREKLFHYLLKKEIINHPKVFYHDTADWDDEHCLVKLSLYELTLMKNSNIQTFDDEKQLMEACYDLRVNHLCNENNIKIAKVIKDNLDRNEKKIIFDKSIIEVAPKPIEYYFKPVPFES